MRRALEEAGGPVLVLIDELMDYALMLTQEGGMAGEQAFLNALFDAVDELPRVAAIVVMIRSDLDEQGYPSAAEAFRDYLTRRMERNGMTVAVTEAQDFSAIIRRRIFQPRNLEESADNAAAAWISADGAWKRNVFDRLPSSRRLEALPERLRRTYPFHPDLMDLVEEEWSRHTGFQRVRSTVTVFAASAYHWQQEHAAGRWAPPLIGPGDIPLSEALEYVLSSGLLHGNDRAIQGFRQVVATDIVSKDRSSGRAVEIDAAFADRAWAEMYPCPAVRAATALFLYSLVPRTQTRRGATKEELLAAAHVPGSALRYQDMDEVFGALTDEESGLGSLEIIAGRGGNTPTRYVLSTAMTLRMFFRRAKLGLESEERDLFLWERAKQLARKGGGFQELIPIDGEDDEAKAFADVDDARSNRLVVLDPRRWTMLNGKDAPTREDITNLLGVGQDPIRAVWAASVAVSCINTQRREQARKRASEALAWHKVLAEITGDDDLVITAQEELRQATGRLDDDIRRAFQHYAYLIRRADRAIEVAWRRFEDDTKSSLSGNSVWDALVEEHRAVRSAQLSADYVSQLVDLSERDLSVAEFVDRFWQDPSYPLVPSPDDVRITLFGLLLAEDGWELVAADGSVLSYESPEQIPVGSRTVYLRSKPPSELKEAEDTAGREPAVREGQTGEPEAEVRYKRFVLELPNRSLTDPAKRDEVWSLLSKITSQVDPAASIDLQLIDLRLILTAPEGSFAEIAERILQLGARWRVEDELL